MFQANRRRPGKRGGSRLDASLQVETLEDRWMPAVIGGIVYLDSNGSGLYEQGKLGLAGSTIRNDFEQTCAITSLPGRNRRSRHKTSHVG